MEVEIRSPIGGKCVALLVKTGDFIHAGQTMLVIEAI
jgi:biotin carboxyl carrier protein